MSAKTLIVDMAAAEPVSYGRILKLQRAWAAGLAQGRLDQMAWLGSHGPVVTLGRRADVGELKVDKGVLEKKGVELHAIERGGLATCHGPGQLVCYPIVRVDIRKLGIDQLVSFMEQAMITMLAHFGLQANIDERNHGVWVGDDKIGFIGLGIRRGVSFHGLAVNINASPDIFELIVPCGLAGVGITSLAKLSGRSVDMGLAGRLIRDSLAISLDWDVESISLEQAEDLAGV